MTLLLQGAGFQIISEGAELTLPDVASATRLLDLRANTLALNDGDPVSTWADQSGQSHDFTRGVGSSDLVKATIGGHAEVQFNGTDDSMIGTNFADNLDAMAVIFIAQAKQALNVPIIASKYPAINDLVPPGWDTGMSGMNWVEDIDYNNIVSISDISSAWQDMNYHVISLVKSNNSTGKSFIDGLDVTLVQAFGIVTTFANSGGIELNAMRRGFNLRALLIYQITNIVDFLATDRAAIEAWLASNT